MPAFSLDDYEPVADRIERFWTDHPDGSIVTELVYHDEKSFIVKATAWREWFSPGSIATGLAEEVIGSSNVNRTSALENCETSAIGRALANLGYAVKNRASREEMEKAQPAPRPRSGGREVTPTPEPQESHAAAPQTNGNDEQALSTVNLKRDLLNRLGGDKPRAQMVWRTTLETFGYAPDDVIPAEMLPIIGDALSAPNWNPE